MTAAELFAKALRAAESAKILLDTQDCDGACNRAYYAMFDAARAAMVAANSPVQPESVRTHGGLIGAFSLHMVKTGRVPVELGRALNKVEELRMIADYKGDSVELADAQWALGQAQEFILAIQALFFETSK